MHGNATASPIYDHGNIIHTHIQTLVENADSQLSTRPRSYHIHKHTHIHTHTYEHEYILPLYLETYVYEGLCVYVFMYVCLQCINSLSSKTWTLYMHKHTEHLHIRTFAALECQSDAKIQCVKSPDDQIS